MDRQEIWLRAWVAVAGSFNAKVPDCNRYADACLAAFDERFPPTRYESLWCGIPLSDLTDEEKAEMKAWRDNGYSTLL